VGSAFECPAPNVRDPNAGNLDLPLTGLQGLTASYDEAVMDQLGQHTDLESEF
jgi:hypothetical protein